MKLFALMLFVKAASNVTAQTQTISTIAGNNSLFTGLNSGIFSGDSGLATAANLNNPISVAVDSNGVIYIADEFNGRIRTIDTFNIMHTIAGNGYREYRGDDSNASSSAFCDFGYIKLDASNNLYIPDVCNERIRVIGTNDTIKTFLGDGVELSAGDGESYTAASTAHPLGITFDGGGNVFFTEGLNHVRKIDASRTISLLAGSGTGGGYSGDDGPATNALLHLPIDIAVDLYGNAYITDAENNVIRKVDTAGIITKYAGTTTAGYSGDFGMATDAEISYPVGIVCDGEGNVFFTDCDNNAIRKIDHNTNIITTIAGNGTEGFSGDGGLAVDAQLYHPAGIAFDKFGNLFIADWLNNRIRKVTNVGIPLQQAKTQRNTTHVNAYPNPATKIVTISCPPQSEVKIIDLTGNVLKLITSVKNYVTVDISMFEPGIYCAEIENLQNGISEVIKLQKE